MEGEIVIGRAVIHHSFGEGIVVNIIDNYITIKFKIGVKKFIYPDIFNTYLKLEDNSLLTQNDNIIENEKGIQMNPIPKTDIEDLITTEQEEKIEINNITRYKRYKSDIRLTKKEKVQLMSEYINYYEDLIKEQGIDILNIKIPRDVFDNILNDIGVMLNKQAIKLANEDDTVKIFLRDNPLPPNMQGLLPDDFRVFALLLNSLKQWVSSESASTDRFLLGGTAKDTCKEAVDKCIVTGNELGEKPELHHLIRDGRPPILLSKKGHDLVEQNNQINNTDNTEDDDVWNIIKQIRKDQNMSWVQLREGCNVLITGSMKYRPKAKSFANKVIKETALSATDIIEKLNEKNL